MVNENVMLKLDGKHTHEVSFFQKSHAFLQVCVFFKKLESIAQTNNFESSQNDGFYNTWAACAPTKKTLHAVGEDTRFRGIIRGNRKAEARGDEGSERCCCCCCCCCEGCCCRFGCCRRYCCFLL